MSAEKIAYELRIEASGYFDRLATISELMLRAADALDAKDKRIAELEAALEPFVRHYEPWMDACPDTDVSFSYSRHTLGQLRQARALLASSLPNKEDRNG